ncbi:hypothetical protein T492DRAFT_1084945 [Pavlovales sp. CCMP2436]|nr:hypothetical protein T492DRAFT_1084945 [Pavlovales sp. CCMP2436]
MIVDDGGIFSGGERPRSPQGRLRKSLGASTTSGAKLGGRGGRSATTATLAVEMTPIRTATLALSLDIPRFSQLEASAEPRRNAPLAGYLRNSELGPGDLDAELSAYAIRSSVRGGVRLVDEHTRRVIHAAVFAEHETGMGAWLCALKHESADGSREQAMDLEIDSEEAMQQLPALRAELDLAPPMAAHRAESGDRELPRDAVGAWLLANGVSPPREAGGARRARVSLEGEGARMPALDERRLAPHLKPFVDSHFELLVHGKQSLEALDREFSSKSRQAQFENAVSSLGRNRIHVPGGGAGGRSELIASGSGRSPV